MHSLLNCKRKGLENINQISTNWHFIFHDDTGSFFQWKRTNMAFGETTEGLVVFENICFLISVVSIETWLCLQFQVNSTLGPSMLLDSQSGYKFLPLVFSIHSWSHIFAWKIILMFPRDLGGFKLGSITPTPVSILDLSMNHTNVSSLASFITVGLWFLWNCFPNLHKPIRPALCLVLCLAYAYYRIQHYLQSSTWTLSLWYLHLLSPNQKGKLRIWLYGRKVRVLTFHWPVASLEEFIIKNKRVILLERHVDLTRIIHKFVNRDRFWESSFFFLSLSRHLFKKRRGNDDGTKRL